MPLLQRAAVCMAVLGALSSGALAADDIHVGSTREEVIAVYGMPRAQLSAGAKEILTYSDGRITLTAGLVSKLEIAARPRLPQAAPAAVAPAVIAAPVISPPAPEGDIWRSDFAQAKAEAAASKRRILVLFTGSDWCPPCMEFEEKVAHHPDFLATTHAAFVLLRLDYPRARPQSPAVRAANEEIRRKYGVRAFPTLLILGADGGNSVRVDTTVSRQADDITDYFVQAVDEARRKKTSDSSSWWPF